MQDFIILGEIPGTHATISFQAWLFFSAAVITLGLLIGLRRTIYKAFLGWRVARLIRHFEISPFVLVK